MQEYIIYAMQNNNFDDDIGIIFQKTWYIAQTKEIVRQNTMCSILSTNNMLQTDIPTWVLCTEYIVSKKKPMPDILFTNGLLVATSLIICVCFYWPGFMTHYTLLQVGKNMHALFVICSSHALMLYLTFINPFNFQTQTSTMSYIEEEYTQARQSAIAVTLVALGISAISSVMNTKMTSLLFIGTCTAFVISSISVAKLYTTQTRENLIRNEIITEQLVCIAVSVLAWTFLCVVATEMFLLTAIQFQYIKQFFAK
jgi:hypothetical protein